MTRPLHILALVAASLLPAGAGAQTTTSVLVDRLQSEGYTWIEVKNGPSQTKVEAIRGTEELEFVFDNGTGAILKQERGQADASDIGRTGLEVDSRDRDFVGSARRNNENTHRRRDDDDDMERDDDDDRGRGGERDRDDRGRGGDRDRDDDRGQGGDRDRDDDDDNDDDDDDDDDEDSRDD